MNRIGSVFYSVFILLFHFSSISFCAKREHTTLHKIIHEDAKCLDGSIPEYFHRKGNGNNKNKWIIYFQGGGWPYALQDFWKRSKTNLGSTMYGDRGSSMEGIIYDKKRHNPYFYNWNAVVVKYCDGTSFSSNAIHHYNGSVLFMKGEAIRRELVNTLLRTDILPHSLSQASEVIISGSSAGSLAVLLGIDQIAAQIRDGAKSNDAKDILTVRGLINSAFFMDYTSPGRVILKSSIKHSEFAVTARTIAVNGDDRFDYSTAFRDLFALANMSAGANPDCIKAHSEGVKIRNFLPASDCAFASNLLPHIKTPVFLLQSRHDKWQIKYVLGQEDLKNLNARIINDFGDHLVTELQIAIRGTAHGVYLDSCFHHGEERPFLKNMWWNDSAFPSVPVNMRRIHSEEDNVKTIVETRYMQVGPAFVQWYEQSLTTQRTTSSLENNLKQRSLNLLQNSNSASSVAERVNWFSQDKIFPCNACCSSGDK